MENFRWFFCCCIVPFHGFGHVEHFQTVNRYKSYKPRVSMIENIEMMNGAREQKQTARIRFDFHIWSSSHTVVFLLCIILFNRLSWSKYAPILIIMYLTLIYCSLKPWNPLSEIDHLIYLFHSLFGMFSKAIIINDKEKANRLKYYYYYYEYSFAKID